MFKPTGNIHQKALEKIGETEAFARLRKSAVNIVMSRDWNDEDLIPQLAELNFYLSIARLVIGESKVLGAQLHFDSLMAHYLETGKKLDGARDGNND